MIANLSTKGSAVKLIFDIKPRLSGGLIEGVVEIDFPKACSDEINLVEIAFTGVASTYVIPHASLDLY
jgi:hypothetical protein